MSVYISQQLFDKLEAFIRKYYQNQLIKGGLLFVGTSLLYLLLTVSVEYFLWLQPTARAWLFGLFVLVQLALLVQFIVVPLLYLFRLRKGLTPEGASAIIGAHFTEVGDKLTNFLQLYQQAEQSELLMAAIDQKAALLKPIPFVNAIDFKSNKKYLPWALIPLSVLLFFYATGKGSVVSQPLQRVLHFSQHYEKPAPFQWFILNKKLHTQQGVSFTLHVETRGQIVPDKVFVVIGTERYLMETNDVGDFTYIFENPIENQLFYLEANGFKTPMYTLEVWKVPAVQDIQLKVIPPAYTGKKPTLYPGTGNAIVPEGSVIQWNIVASATDVLRMEFAQTKALFTKQANLFSMQKQLLHPLHYQIISSNAKLPDFEKIPYDIQLIPDQYPSILVEKAPDSLGTEKDYFIGKVSDDYGLHQLKVHYFPKGKPEAAKKYLLPVKRDVVDQFVFAFPGDLPVEAGVTYEFFFEVFDNDAIHHFKSSRSGFFTNHIATESELKQQQLTEQKETFQNLSKAVKSSQKEQQELDKLQKLSKEKSELDYKDHQKVTNFLERQEVQEELMKQFADKLKKNLDKMEVDKNDPEKKALQERLEKTSNELEKNNKLLDEIKKLQDKISKDELFDKLDQYQQQSKNQTKSLEQLLELTKKFYVEQKFNKLADDLEKLAEKQDKLPDNQEDNSKEAQDELNKSFEEFKKQYDELQKENQGLKLPMDLPNNDAQEQQVQQEQQQATQKLGQQKKEAASKNQKNAAKKMRQMRQDMQQQQQGMEMQQMDEDNKAMRQILDNLLAFSFDEEALMNQVKSTRNFTTGFSKQLKKQQDLRQQFKHIDDSIFALSLRNPFIADDINKEIGQVHYNMDKAIETLTEGNFPKGISHQQFTTTGANQLANLLADALQSMQSQMKMSGMGSGKPKSGKNSSEIQLPDIIKKQDALGKKMQKGQQQGQQSGQQQGESEQNKEGKPNQKGEGQHKQQGGQGQDGEGDAEQIMEIYKEQQQLREALQKSLQEKGNVPGGQSTIDEMKQLEKQLLNKGINPQTIQKALQIQYELLKLEKALHQQGEDTKRQANTNKNSFNNNAKVLPEVLQKYMRSIEILNRDALPLRPDLNQRVKAYFNQP